MPLAGIGSRFIALLVDYLIWGAGIVFLVWFFAFPARPAGLQPSLRINGPSPSTLFLIFLFNWGYFTLFEAFWHGRTPGKRVAGIRVIQRSGRAIGIFESMARNFVRYVDQIPVLLRGRAPSLSSLPATISASAISLPALSLCAIASRRHPLGEPGCSGGTLELVHALPGLPRNPAPRRQPPALRCA